MPIAGLAAVLQGLLADEGRWILVLDTEAGRAEAAEERACTVAVAPLPLVCRWREDRPCEHCGPRR
jgi:hypothetical protein